MRSSPGWILYAGRNVVRLEVGRKKDLSFLICLVTHWVHRVFLVSCPPMASPNLCTKILRLLDATWPTSTTCCSLPSPYPASPLGTGTPSSFRLCSLLSLRVLLLPGTFSLLLLCCQLHFFHPWGLSVQASLSQGRLLQGQLPVWITILSIIHSLYLSSFPSECPSLQLYLV